MNNLTQQISQISNYKIERFEEKTLFQNNKSSLITEQKIIFNNIEKNLNFEYANNLSNLVHFQLSAQTPIQRWYPYREGYSIKLVDTFLKHLKIKGNVFDPFAGSGTTLLSARHKNLQSFGIDVNPISILISKIANTKYNKNDILQIASELSIFSNLKVSNSNLKTSFELAGKVFNKDILQTLLQIKEHISRIENKKIYNIFFVAWLSIIEEVSNVKKEGNGIKYKNRKRTSNGYFTIEKEKWEESVFPKDKFQFVKIKFTQKIKLISSDIKENYGSIDKKPQIFNNNCVNFNELFNDEIELTFFSPPYCNSFDYFEIHKVELWLGEFVKNKEEFRLLKNSGFRSNTNALNGKPINYINGHVENLINLFDTKRLWNKRIPNVVRGYFDDMHSLLKNLYNQTTKSGYVGIVVGNSAYSGVIIPTDAIIADFAREIGFTVENIFITRHLTTSSQQKIELSQLNNFLRESIIILKK